MIGDKTLRLTARELSQGFSEPAAAGTFPHSPMFSQAAELLFVRSATCATGGRAGSCLVARVVRHGGLINRAGRLAKLKQGVRSQSLIVQRIRS
jgi:hypothetical protein